MAIFARQATVEDKERRGYSLPMENEIDAYELPHQMPIWVTWLAFAVGLTGALSLRLILVARLYSPELVRLYWYIGVIGNMLFFLFRTFITWRRRRLIMALNILEKLEKRSSLTERDYVALQYLVSSIYVSKERWNYFVIFFFSILAIAWDLWVSG
ncbi:MAG: hypothetical protein GXO58_02635 [Thermodesulfobacteria bacterium]|nr:hypothetical protein [Thermodesulfobacteriota bacterium]